MIHRDTRGASQECFLDGVDVAKVKGPEKRQLLGTPKLNKDDSNGVRINPLGDLNVVNVDMVRKKEKGQVKSSQGDIIGHQRSVPLTADLGLNHASIGFITWNIHTIPKSKGMSLFYLRRCFEPFTFYETHTSLPHQGVTGHEPGKG